MSGKDTPQNKWNIALLEKSEGFIREVLNAWSTDGITKKGQYLWGDNGMAVIHNIEAGKQNPPTYITGMNVMNKPQYFANKILLNDKDSLWVGDTVFVNGQTIINTGYTDIKTFTWDSILAPYNMPVHLSIPYNKNYIQFQFTAAHLSSPEPTLYTYVLEGIDKNWSIPIHQYVY